MYLPTVVDNANTFGMVETWLGYNHNARIGAGEFYDEDNMSSDNYPLLSPRKIRPKLIDTGEDVIRGAMLANGNIAYLAGKTFHYSTVSIDLSEYFGDDSESDQQIVRFGAYALIFPAGIWINLSKTAEYGPIKESISIASGTTITYSMTTISGAEYNPTVSETAPESPSAGAYWLDTKDGEWGLYLWDANAKQWQGIASTYIKITIPGAHLTEKFAEGDAVTLNTKYPDINDGSIIQAIADDYMVVQGLMPKATDTEITSATWTLTITRKIPTLDYVCVANNRVWGCHYGEDGYGGLINEIYASKLGDFKNWYTYAGDSTDSYALSIGMGEKFTGAVEYHGYPTFFKEDYVLKIYGAAPSEFQLITNSCRGVQDGSYKSIVKLNEYLIYKSPSDVVVYDGSNPTSISQAFGRGKMYYDAVAGGCLNRYHIVMEDVRGNPVYLVYDLQYGIWTKYDNLRVKCFTAGENGQIYAATKTEIFGVGSNENSMFLNPMVSEEYVSWSATTGDIGLEYAGYKLLKRITLRAYIPATSEIVVQIAYDGRPFENVGVMRGHGDVQSKSFDISPFRCDHYRIRFSGHGDVRIYTMQSTVEEVSEKR